VLEDIMRIFLAGSTGAIGVPLLRVLIAAGHDVTALTRSPGKIDMLRALGAVPAVADALDPEALHRAVIAARPTHVIHQLTALPKAVPRRASDLEPTNRLRLGVRPSKCLNELLARSVFMLVRHAPNEAPPQTAERVMVNGVGGRRRSEAEPR
jgi:uncharacterized protein YbjT (DUF2867 family)